MVWTRKAAFGRPFAHQGAFPQRPPCRAALPPVPAAPLRVRSSAPCSGPPLWGPSPRSSGVLPRRAFPAPSPSARAPRRLRCGRGAVPASFSGPAGPSPVRPGTGAPPVRGARLLRGGLSRLLAGHPAGSPPDAAFDAPYGGRPAYGGPLSRMRMGAFAHPVPAALSAMRAEGPPRASPRPEKPRFSGPGPESTDIRVENLFFSLMGAVLQFFYERSHKIMQWRGM